MGIWGLSLTLLIICFHGELWGWTPISYLFCILHSLRSRPLGAGRCSVEIWLGGRLDGRPGRVASESLRRPFCFADHSQYARCGGELLSNRHRQSRQKEAWRNDLISHSSQNTMWRVPHSQQNSSNSRAPVHSKN